MSNSFTINAGFSVFKNPEQDNSLQFILCPHCNKGNVYFTACCGVTVTKYAVLCPDCRTVPSIDAERCEQCNGTGELSLSDAREAAAELKLMEKLSK